MFPFTCNRQNQRFAGVFWIVSIKNIFKTIELRLDKLILFILKCSFFFEYSYGHIDYQYRQYQDKYYAAKSDPGEIVAACK